MAAPTERILDLAKDSLAAQERDLSGLRSRVPPVIAAAAVAASLLVEPVFAGGHPQGVVQVLAAVVGLSGLAIVIAATSFVLAARDLGFDVDSTRLYEEARTRGLLTNPEGFDRALAASLRERRRRNEAGVRRVRVALTISVAGLVTEVAGLALAVAL